MLKEISLIGRVYNSIRFLTAASLFVTRVKKDSKLRISTTRWGQRSKIALNVLPEISQRIFRYIKIFLKRNFQHPI